MYVPDHFAETRTDVLHALIRDHPLASLASFDGDALTVDHLPLLLDAETGPHGTLRGHVARANPLWQANVGAEPVAVFQGPAAYVTPSWYPSKRQHGKVVPTWNYAVVHVYGTPTFYHDADQLLAHVNALSNRHEASRPRPWRVDDAPAEFIDKMLAAIVGVEITITRLSGKWKISQNRSTADRDGVTAGLAADRDPLAELIGRYAAG